MERLWRKGHDNESEGSWKLTACLTKLTTPHLYSSHLLFCFLSNHLIFTLLMHRVCYHPNVILFNCPVSNSIHIHFSNVQFCKRKQFCLLSCLICLYPSTFSLAHYEVTPRLGKIKSTPTHAYTVTSSPNVLYSAVFSLTCISLRWLSQALIKAT